MKKYVLEAVIDGEFITFDIEFDSRDEAIDYIFKYFDRHDLESFKITDEYYIAENKHDIEYVSDYNNRFRIARI